MARKTRVATKTGRETKAGFVSADIQVPDVPDYVVVELRYESPIAFSAAKFAAPAAAAPQAETLNDVLAKYDIKTIRSHFGLPSPVVKKRFAKKGVDTTFIHSGFVQILPKRSGDASRIARELKRKQPVWDAFVAPRPVPAAVATGSQAGSRDCEPARRAPV